MIRLFTAAALAAILGGTALAQQGVTVKGLLAQDFAVVGAITSNAGPGLFLQKKDKVFFCVVSETPTSASVATRYCKPVE
jgi:hypothetical protein